MSFRSVFEKYSSLLDVLIPPLPLVHCGKLEMALTIIKL